MANYTSAQGFFGLLSTPEPERTNSSLAGTQGVPEQRGSYGDKPIYCIGLEFGKAGDEVTLNPLTGVLSGASAASAAGITFELVSNPANNDTFTIGSTVYTFKTTASLVGEVQIGATPSNTASALENEINGYASHPPDPLVGAVAIGQDITLAALAPGPDGNAITLAKSNPASWDGLGPNLIGGSDGTQYEVFEGDGKDCEGLSLPSSDDNPAFLMTVSAGRIKATDGADYSGKAAPVSATFPGHVSFGSDLLSFAGDITISCVAMPDSGPAFASVQLLLEPV